MDQTTTYYECFPVHRMQLSKVEGVRCASLSRLMVLLGQNGDNRSMIGCARQRLPPRALLLPLEDSAFQWRAPICIADCSTGFTSTICDQAANNICSSCNGCLVQWSSTLTVLRVQLDVGPA
mmetsp:Transcript_76770/g.212103  ORF Transcript_76770/g.212103 Transcript_76770/m.212103 type:complete len:122 (-) Transcript_76770:846-1211(-)